MSIANDALMVGLGQVDEFWMIDSMAAVAANNAQAKGTRCTAPISRFVLVSGSGVAVLPSLLTGEAGPIQVVVNDGANALPVYPFGTETLNGGTTPLSVPAGQSGLFIKVTAAQATRNGGIAPGSFANDWRAVAIP